MSKLAYAAQRARVAMRNIWHAKNSYLAVFQYLNLIDEVFKIAKILKIRLHNSSKNGVKSFKMLTENVAD